MKKTIEIFKTTLVSVSFYTASLLIALASCKSPASQENATAVATEKNDAKFPGKKGEDADFLVAAVEINLTEIQLGKLAQGNSKMADVQQLGRMMETDHSRALKEVQDLAAKKQITIPATLSNEQQSSYQELLNKRGDDFDKEYCNMMVKGHQEAIEKFSKEATYSKDADIKAWAASMLPALRMHLDNATTCQKRCDLMILITTKQTK
jgi:putative membrane protein